MTLPYDVARCLGTKKAECKDCLRRTSPPGPWQPWIEARATTTPCKSRIAREVPEMSEGREKPSLGKPPA